MALCGAGLCVHAQAPLTVCIAEDNEPLSYLRKGEPKGLDVRVARAIAAAKRNVKPASESGSPSSTEIRFTVVSGGAIGIDRNAFLNTACNNDGSVEFRATVGHVKPLKDALIEYMHERSMPLIKEFKVAWLTETVSGYG